MSTASERVLSSMNLIVAESEKNLVRLKEIETQTATLKENLNQAKNAIDQLDKRLAELNTESQKLKDKAMKLIIEHLEPNK